MKSLRAARREAYHASRPPEVSLDLLRTASVEDLERRAGEMEGALAELHERVSAALAKVDDPRAATFAALAAKERDNAWRLGGGATADGRTDPLPQETDALVALATERLESAVELYLAAADVAQREEVVSAAQGLAEDGIRRLSELR